MLTAENGEFSIQSSIALWVGATHWSNPYPVKFPGVTRLSACAGAANENEVSIALQIAADNRATRGRIRDSTGEGSGELNPPSPHRNTPSAKLGRSAGWERGCQFV